MPRSYNHFSRIIYRYIFVMNNVFLQIVTKKLIVHTWELSIALNHFRKISFFGHCKESMEFASSQIYINN